MPEPVEGAGVAIKTGAHPHGSGVFVVDLDGEGAFDAWCDLGGGGFDDEGNPTTRVVRTGRADGNGWHIYFRHPGFHVKTSAGSKGGLWSNGKPKDEGAEAIDIRGDGGIAIVEGSPHASGREYELLSPEGMEPSDAPEWLLAWLRTLPAPTETQTYAGDVSDAVERDYRRSLYRDYLATTEPCVDGRGGDNRLFEVVQRGAYDFALPTEDVLEDVEEVFDPRCEPPWGAELEERVLRKAHDAKTASTRPRMAPPPSPAKDPDVHRIFKLGLTPEDLAMPAIGPGGLPDVPPERAQTRAERGIVWGDWDEPVAPPTWLVHGLIPIETVGMFVAMGSSLKTWTALDIGRSVVTGTMWLDRFPVRKGKVVVVDYESGIYELRRRIQLLERDDVRTDLKHLGVWTYPDQRIDDERFWDMLAALDDVELVVIDSLAAGAPGVDENANVADMPLQWAARLSNSTGATVLFIHHATKGDGGGDARKRVKGNASLYAACDWVYEFEDVAGFEAVDAHGNSVRRMRMKCIKPCMSARPAPVNIEMSDERAIAWFDEDGQESMAAARGALVKERTPEAIQAAIKLLLAGGPIESQKILAKKLGVKLETTRISLEALLVRREVTFIKGSGYAIDDDSLRTARIKAIVSGYAYWRSESAIAKAAGVEPTDVADLVRAGGLAKSGDQRWLVRNEPALDVAG